MKKILALILALLLVFALALPAATAFADSAVPTAAESVMQTFREQVVKMVLEFLAAALLALFGWLGIQAKKLYNNLATTEIKRTLCRDTVRYIEQVYKDVHGQEKMNAAMRKASEWLEEYGIAIRETELVTMLEAAVNEFNGNFQKTEESQKTADKLNRMLQ